MPEPTLDSIAARSRLYANLLMVESRLLERLLGLRAQLPADDPLHGSLQDAIHSLQVAIHENAVVLLEGPDGQPAANEDLQRRTDEASHAAEQRWQAGRRS
jgi:hypothetical protein